MIVVGDNETRICRNRTIDKFIIVRVGSDIIKFELGLDKNDIIQIEQQKHYILSNSRR